MFFLPADSLPLLTDELEWQLVGKKLNEGLHLYSEIQTETPPFSAYFFKFTDTLFGTNPIALRSIALVLVFTQVLQFNRMINKRNLFHERNYIPGLLFLILMHVSFDLLKLSPMLLANTFFLWGVNSILRQIERRDGIGDDIFEGGLYFGFATLFYHPSFVFMIWAILILFLFTGINIRQAFMVILAYILPIFLVYVLFYFNNHGAVFLDTYLFNLNELVSVTLLSIRDILIVYTLPIVLSLLGILKVMRGQRYNSFQNRSHQSLLILGIFGIVSFLISGEYVPANLIFLITPLAFYIAGFFTHLKSIFIPETAFAGFFATVFLLLFIGARGIFGYDLNLLSDYRIASDAEKLPYEGKRLFITGRSLDGYLNNDMAMGYINWGLAKEDFENPNNYLSISNIYNNFKKDMPEIIVDEAQVMPKIFEKIPELALQYRKVEKDTYERKINSN